MARFRADPSPDKVDLGVGVYRDLSGATPILDCVHRAERLMLAAQATKSYVAAAGRAEFNEGAGELVLGPANSAAAQGRVRIVQAPGGCGALRVGAELIRAAAPAATVHVSDPTWGNHTPLLGGSGLKLAKYPYYDATTHELKFAAMLEHLDRAPAGDVVLLHACCHNPTGADLSLEQWREVADLLERRRLLPLLDLAYQGFGAGLEPDVAGIRLVIDRVPEALVAVSFSKNLGLYRERLGALIAIGASAAEAESIRSQVLQIARGIYSMPPDHGAAIAAHIFANEVLRDEWILELLAMRRRIEDMRALLSRHLREKTGTRDFDFLEAQHGMFSLLGCSGEAVARLRDRFHIYLLGDSRMNLAGITPGNVAYVAEAIASLTARR
jgi:aspartate aminotransferase